MQQSACKKQYIIHDTTNVNKMKIKLPVNSNLNLIIKKKIFNTYQLELSSVINPHVWERSHADTHTQYHMYAKRCYSDFLLAGIEKLENPFF